MKDKIPSSLWLVAKEPCAGRSGVMNRQNCNRVWWVCLEQKIEKKVARDGRRKLGLKEHGSELSVTTWSFLETPAGFSSWFRRSVLEAGLWDSYA